MKKLYKAAYLFLAFFAWILNAFYTIVLNLHESENSLESWPYGRTGGADSEAAGTPPSYTISCMKFSYELFENGIMFILIFTVMLKESDGVSAACTVPPVRP